MRILIGIIKETTWSVMHYAFLSLSSLSLFKTIPCGELSADKPNIILVYGFLGMYKTFMPLKERLEKLGYNVLTPDLGCTMHDLSMHAHRLIIFLKDRELILQKNHHKSLNDLKNNLVFLGHSMGGLIILEAQRLNASLNKMKVITCGTPIKGTPVAYCCAFFSKAARQIIPDSTFINTLQEDLKINARNLTQLKAEIDLAVPECYSSLSTYPSHVVSVIGHVSLVFDLPDEVLKKLTTI